MKKLFLFMTLTLLAVTPLCAQQEVNSAKLSPYLESLFVENSQKQATSSTDNLKVCALMKLNEGASIDDVMKDYGCTFEAQIGKIYILNIPVANLAAMSNDDRIWRIETNKAPEISLDTVQFITGADKIYAGQSLPQAYTGAGVVAGIVDSGIDFTHPMFRDASGKSRIQTAYDYPAGQGWTTPEAVLAAGCTKVSTSDAYHGTHVLGIMAGSKDVNGKYSGIAYDADLCVMDITNSNKAFPTDGTTAECILAFKRIFDYADDVNKPCVINISMNGSATMPSNPYLLESDAIDDLVGPGRIIIVAAGNYGKKYNRLYKPAGKQRGGCISSFNRIFSSAACEFDVRTTGPVTVTVSVLGNSNSTITGSCVLTTDAIDNASNKKASVTQRISSRSYTLTGTRISDAYNPTGNTYHFSVPATSSMGLTTYGIMIEGEAEADARFEPFYTTNLNSAKLADYNCAVREGSVMWPAHLKSVIGVGCLGYRYSFVNSKGATQTDDSNELGVGKLANFSSRGPGISNELKPEISAPGVCIRSAFNSYNSTTGSNADKILDPFTYEGKTYYMLAISGTSMAAPVVTGTVALWLQAKPDLTVDDLRDIFAHTATIPDESLEYPNNMYGYGKIDAYKGLLYILNLSDKIDNLSDHQPAKAQINLVGGNRIEFDFGGEAPKNYTVNVYTVEGKQVGSYRLSGNGQSVDLSHLGKGVYAVQLNTGSKATTGSTLIRL